MGNATDVEVPVETEGTDDGAEEAHILLELLITPSQTGDDGSVGVAGTILFAAEISLSGCFPFFTPNLYKLLNLLMLSDVNCTT